MKHKVSAGTGVTHSEFNPSKTDGVKLLQMWVLPAKLGTPPRYEQKAFGESERRGRLCLVASPNGERGSISIGQDVSLWVALLDDGEEVRHDLAPGRSAWLHVARGRLVLNDVELGPGDGAGIREDGTLHLAGVDNAELVLFDLR